MRNQIDQYFAAKNKTQDGYLDLDTVDKLH